ncbi:hypothetical protein IFM89_022664 [Coptis chinensis]|uniref:non-specific serine/threonine protein kinase n=1 Tax=Coptis chinensis TaxID=261450 RepID=A0A835H888_9MAGN|nr:hypothetical protein IFM89_022664 [Coptis chinensis]
MIIMKLRYLLFFNHFTFLLFFQTKAQKPGFKSFDCGGKDKFTDDLGLEWAPDQLMHGETANLSVTNETRKQYMTLRYFPADERKYCYTLDVKTRTRYLIRATFLYGNFDNNNVYPKFDISLGPTHWSTIVISDASTMEVQELIFLATSPTVSVCLSNATTGQPFISTLELRQFNGSVYYTDHESQFFLSVSARINFGADSEDPVRYPDDPFDRIWQSDTLRKANYLVDVAAGTEKVSTKMPIDVNTHERPPEKVMQTAVLGTKGSLTYRLNLDGFPGYGWAFSYFAEIEDFSPNETRKFRLFLPGTPDVSKAAVNIQENAQGKYRLYEPGFPNISLPFILNFGFRKTPDSSRGPLLNAMEINKYLKINDGSLDGTIMDRLVSRYPSSDWAQEGGDPCMPVPWSWVRCSLEPQPRIVSMNLSRKNLTGRIPLEVTNLPGLVELWFDGNSLTGPIPDFTGSKNLKIIHLENNQLAGNLPSSLTELQNLRELYLQNNLLSGSVPSRLLKTNLVFNYSGNSNLHKEGSGGNRMIIIVGSSVGIVVLLIATIASYLFIRRKKKRHTEDKCTGILPAQRMLSNLSDASAETMHCFALSDIEEATGKFERKIGSGGFGVVYYGRMKDGKEIAVKILTSNTYQGKREFSNEVSLLSRIHHRNLVQFLGYCQEEGKSILVYDYMHNGTLKEHLYGPLARERSISWIKRLEIAEDAAKVINSLETSAGKMRYYISQQLTDKSDVYSFGVILLELISGQEAISKESFGVNCRNIVQWAKLHVESGDIQGIIDPSLRNEFDIQSVWKIAEKAMMCVQSHGSIRPSISEVLKDIQDAIMIERGTEEARESKYGDLLVSTNSSTKLGSPEMGVTEPYVSFDESIPQPTAR